MIKTLLITLLFGFAAGIASAQHHENGLAGNAPAAYSVQKTSNSLYSQYRSWLYLPWYVTFSTDLKKDNNQTLKLKIDNNKNTNSKGNTCQVIYFLTN
jgi:sialidase-1